MQLCGTRLLRKVHELWIQALRVYSTSTDRDAFAPCIGMFIWACFDESVSNLFPYLYYSLRMQVLAKFVEQYCTRIRDRPLAVFLKFYG